MSLPHHFPSRPTALICVSLQANGESSYRDANNLARLGDQRFEGAHIYQITDCPQHVTLGNVIEVHTSKKLLSELQGIVATTSPERDILMVISAHGYTDGKQQCVHVNGTRATDVELREAFYAGMDDSCTSLVLIDTCHSGTMFDLPFLSLDGGHTGHHMEANEASRPNSWCIAACADNELAGEDVSDYGGWGGKLVCHTLDYLTVHSDVHIIDFYQSVYGKFSHQGIQRSHPTLSSTKRFFPYHE
jgi:hypothetical protein